MKVRKLRQIDTGSYGVTLPKREVVEKVMDGDEDEGTHRDTLVFIECEEEEEGDYGLSFRLRLVDKSDLDGSEQSGLDEFSTE